MKILRPWGHVYELNHLDGPNKTILQFVQRAPHHEPKEGVQCQEVLRALIHRVKILNSELSWTGNKEIIFHLRAALLLFETRALFRHLDKDEIEPEKFKTGDDGHFAYPYGESET